MIPNLGGTELIIILVIVLLIFGAKRIPELAKGLGTGMREFRKGVSEGQKALDEDRDARAKS
jgi:sec-independent protein translocase protein TatA